MGGGIDADAPLDYAAFEIFPAQNRYDAFVCGNNVVEKLAAGIMDQLMLHLSKAKDLNIEESNASFKLQLPQNLTGISWFTKSTVNRFLNIVGSPDLFNNINAIDDEVSQLDKARKVFMPEVKIVSSEASKNELLQAMDLRLRALRGELIAAFNRAAGEICSAENIIDLIKFSDHFEAANLKEALCKILQLAHERLIIDPLNENLVKTEGGKSNNSRQVHSVVPVKYGVSPSKAAQVERQSSTESEESSDNSDEDRTPVERSRTLARSASPRRSASPMRRIQIGKSGSRRAAALTIKSIGYIPPREKEIPQRDSSDEEVCDQPPKKMSVKDAINLFERKKEDKIEDIQKKNMSAVIAKKSVLRRWSAGMGDSSTQSQPEIFSEDSAPISPKNAAITESRTGSEEENKSDSGLVSESINPIETYNAEIKLDTHQKKAFPPLNTQEEGSMKRSTTSMKWNQQKEAELNHMLMQMTANKPVKSKKIETRKSLNLPSEQRGGFYDHYKEKRDEKLRGDNAGKKRAEKEVKLKEMQPIITERKAEMASKNAIDVGKKLPLLHKPQNSNKSVSQSANSKRETSKPSIEKKVSSNSLKSAPVPVVRKSWPSTPQPRTTTGTSPAKTPTRIPSVSPTPTRKKSQPTPAVTRSSPKMERPVQGHKQVKRAQSQADVSKSVKGMNEKPQRLVTKGGKTTKAKVVSAASEDSTSTVRASPTFYNKLTKKSSVVPLESKGFIRKSSKSEIGTDINPAKIKTKVVSQSEVPPGNCGNGSRILENDAIGTNTYVLISQQEEGNLVVLETEDVSSESETRANKHQIYIETQITNQVTVDGDSDNYFKNMVDCPLIVQDDEEEQSTISSHAWVETKESPNFSIQNRDFTSQLASPANIAPEASSSPRIRHSLSQMLKEENNESDDIVEWGNAENPPSMIYQKDAPKGLKRLLKNYGQRNKLLIEGHERNVNAGEPISARSSVKKYNAQSSFLSKSQDGQTSSAATTKATRSFFSLSAFRGSKPNLR